MISSSRKIRRMLDNLKLGKLTVWLWISCILVTAVSSQDQFHTNGRFGKRKETRTLSTFQSGSRFGRSESSMVKNTKETSKLFEIVPRMDRFFYGSRYGKRSSSAPLQAAVHEMQRRASLDPASLSLKRFEAAMDYLDRVQHSAARQDLEPENGESDYSLGRPEDDKPDEEAPYRFLRVRRNTRSY